MTTLSDELFDHVAACFTGIWINSFEQSELVNELAGLCRDNDWQLTTWDVCNGGLN